MNTAVAINILEIIVLIVSAKIRNIFPGYKGTMQGGATRLQFRKTVHIFAMTIEEAIMGKNYSFIRELGGILMAAADLVMPRECIVCGKTLLRHEKYLCIYCAADLPLTYYWERRRNPMADKVNALVQQSVTEDFISTSAQESSVGNSRQDDGSRRTSRMRFSYAAALFLYHGENGYRRIPQRLKYMGDLGEGRFFSGMLGGFLNGSPLFSDIDLIIPVPLHWARRLKRGYNQAEVIARAISEKSGRMPVRTDILIRKRHTRTQTKLNVNEKCKNVQGAFALSRKARQGLAGTGNGGYCGGSELAGVRHVLLVDDVFTTGATMSACLAVLQPFFGPSVRISCATLGFVDNG